MLVLKHVMTIRNELIHQHQFCKAVVLSNFASKLGTTLEALPYFDAIRCHTEPQVAGQGNGIG